MDEKAKKKKKSEINCKFYLQSKCTNQNCPYKHANHNYNTPSNPPNPLSFSSPVSPLHYKNNNKNNIKNKFVYVKKEIRTINNNSNNNINNDINENKNNGVNNGGHSENENNNNNNNINNNNNLIIKEEMKIEIPPTILISDNISIDTNININNINNNKVKRKEEGKEERLSPRTTGKGVHTRPLSLSPPSTSKRMKNSLYSKEEEILEQAVNEYRHEVEEEIKEEKILLRSTSKPVLLHRPSFSSSFKGEGVRVMNWNIEWMDIFFKNDQEFEENCERGKVKDILEKIAAVIKEIDPDILSIEEGPSSIEKISLFIDNFLNSSFLPFGGFDGGRQRIFILVKKNGPIKNPKIHDRSDEYFSEKWAFDVNGDLTFSLYSFVRKPIAVSGKLIMKNGEEKELIMLAIHTKSKFIAKGKKLWESEDHNLRHQFIRKSVKNRRSIAGECCRIRKYVDNLFKTQNEPFIIVAGDLNDGPGQDFFEEHYLLFDSVDALLGSPFSGKKCLRPLLIHEKFISKKDQWTCQCHDYVDDISRHVLLDHIFISDSLNRKTRQVAVAHDLFEKYNLSSRYGNRYLSDHHPVFADFEI